MKLIIILPLLCLIFMVKNSYSSDLEYIHIKKSGIFEKLYYYPVDKCYIAATQKLNKVVEYTDLPYGKYIEITIIEDAQNKCWYEYEYDDYGWRGNKGWCTIHIKSENDIINVELIMLMFHRQQGTFAE